MKKKATIITIGDEILYGQTLDTNAHWLSQKLDEINIKVFQRFTIGDEAEQILQTFQLAEQLSDIILITGGLGPTKDDLTKSLLAQYFSCQLVLNEEALQDLEKLFESKGVEMTNLNRSQAFLPERCLKITNHFGTAPGMWFNKNDKVFVSMPGVPYEMKAMMEKYVLPKLAESFQSETIIHKKINTIGIAESKLASMIEIWENNLPSYMKLAYLPSLGQVTLRITTSGVDKNKLKQEVDKQIETLTPIISKYICGFDNETIEKNIGALLMKNNFTLSIAESCTGGAIAKLITSVSGSSAYFKGSVVSYANEIKSNFLDIEPQIIEKYGAVSEQVVKLMAENIRIKFKTNIGLATSGIAGPTGGTDEKPVGTVWIAFANAEKTVAKKLLFTKDRVNNIELSTLACLNLCRTEL